MENLQEQNNQTTEPEKQQEPRNSIDQSEKPAEIDWETFDADIPHQRFPESRSAGTAIYHDGMQPSKKKRPPKDIFSNFYIAVNNGIMTFYFSSISRTKDIRFSQGSDYFYRRFELFSDAIAFYEQNLEFYITKRSVQQIKNYYKKQWDLIENSGSAGAMW